MLHTHTDLVVYPNFHSFFFSGGKGQWSSKWEQLKYIWLGPTDTHQRSQNLRHLYPGMGLKLEVFWFFSHLIKLTMVHHQSLGVYMSPYLLWSEREDKMY